MTDSPMRILQALVIGDPHFKVKNSLECDEFIENLLILCRDRKPDIIICLGDILDRHETIHVEPLTKANYFLRELSLIARLYVIIGNHDRPNNSDFLSPKHPFSALHRWENTQVVDRTFEDTINGYRLLFVPYVPPGRFMEAIETLDTFESIDDYDCVFAHQEFYGAKMGAIQSQVGDPWGNSYPLCVSGHIHDYDVLQHNMIYTGTPMQHAFGDREDKTISIFTFYPEGGVDKYTTGVKQTSWTQERVDLGLIKRQIVYLRSHEVLGWEPPENKLTKVVIRGTNPEIQAAMKLEYVKSLTEKGVKVVYKTERSDNARGNLIIVNANPDSPSNFRPLSYLEALRSRVTLVPDLIPLYEEIFGSV